MRDVAIWIILKKKEQETSDISRAQRVNMSCGESRPASGHQTTKTGRVVPTDPSNYLRDMSIKAKMAKKFGMQVNR